jgi:hypothetical protein
VTESRRQFWGKYRARVESNADPYHIGRLQLKIPDVLGTRTSGWALPAFPYAASSLTPGGGVGLLMVPPAEAWVWAEFEHGDPDRPIWTGCFFSDDPTTLATTMSSLTPAVGVDPAKQVIKAGKWLITIDGDTLTIDHLAAVVPRSRVKLDGTTVKLSTESVPGAGPPAAAAVELSSAIVKVGGAQVQVG